MYEVLCHLEEHDLYLRPKKCEFKRSEIEYLSLVIRHGEVTMDLVKVEAVVNWPISKNLKELRGFIGFANFYRHFIRTSPKVVDLCTTSPRKTLHLRGESNNRKLLTS